MNTNLPQVKRFLAGDESRTVLDAVRAYLTDIFAKRSKAGKAAAKVSGAKITVHTPLAEYNRKKQRESRNRRKENR